MYNHFTKSIFMAGSSLLMLSNMAMAANLNIPGGDLGTALDAYTAQTGIPLIMSYGVVKGTQTKGFKGEISTDEALTRILSGTGFASRRESGAIMIVREKSSSVQISNLQLAQANPSSGRIEEVLVTARRREEAVENIPISISALNAEDLKSFGVRNFADLEGVVPGLNLGGGGNGVKRDSSPFIRGVGQRETKVTLDPAVATYIEGVYIGRAAGAMLDIVDVDNIQVLRGPQGTLFGKNATGGAISVSLKKPNNNWEASIGANIGNYGRRDINGTINIPFIEDMLMGRLTIASANSNGFFTNLTDNTKWGGDNRITGIAQLRYVPTDRITVDLFGERTRIRETPRPQRCAFLRNTGFKTVHMDFINGNGLDPSFMVDGLNRYEGLCKRAEKLPPSRFQSDQTNNPGSVIPQGRYWVDTSTAAATANWDVGDLAFLSDFNVKSISAWRKTRQIADEDLDAIAGTFLIRTQPDFDETTQWSQELTFSGKTLNDRLFLSTGGFWFKEETPKNDLILSAGMTPALSGAAVGLPGYYIHILAEAAKERLQTRNESFAWFGQADFDITPELQLTGGLRWTRENRWSRYSKSYALDTSLVKGNILQRGDLSGLLMAIVDAPGLNPISSWTFANREYFFTRPSGVPPSPVDYRLIPDKFIGDEMKFSNEAWTPMASLKYKLNDRWLQRFSLDQAMFYATYSQGFHSGGVTNGAIDTDAGTLPYPSTAPAATRTNVVATTGIPCRTMWTLNPAELSCPNSQSLPEDGYGTADPITFRPEKVTNYEVGFKLTGLDRRVQANLAAFYMDYTDMQTTAVGSRFGIPVPYIENVGKSVIQGIEAEIVIMPTPQWRLFMTGSYTDADIKEWMTHVVPLNDDGRVLPSQPEYDFDRSDERMPRVPRWQFFASTEYNFRLPGGGSITPSVGVRFTSSIYHGFDRGSWVYSYGGYYYNHGGDRPPTVIPTAANCTRVSPPPSATCGWNGANSNPQADPRVNPSPDAKWKTTSRPTAFLDGRLNWISEDGKMEAALWGKNLTNEDDYLVGGIPLADVTGAVGQVFANPRTFGLTFTYHFGE